MPTHVPYPQGIEEYMKKLLRIARCARSPFVLQFLTVYRDTMIAKTGGASPEPDAEPAVRSPQHSRRVSSRRLILGTGVFPTPTAYSGVFCVRSSQFMFLYAKTYSFISVFIAEIKYSGPSDRDPGWSVQDAPVAEEAPVVVSSFEGADDDDDDDGL